MTYKELTIEIDMLKGNINRICLTNDMDEFKRMCDVSIIRLFNIQKYNEDRINAKHV